MQDLLNSSQWVITPKMNLNAEINLFCFPYAGGSAHIYHAWSDILPTSVNLHCIQLPGRASLFHVPPYTCLKKLIVILHEQIFPYINSKPFMLFGHSLGALLAFEFTKYLFNKENILPKKLFVSACAGPREVRESKQLHKLSDEELLEQIKKFNGTPDTILANDELVSMLIPILRADFCIFETYEYDHRLTSLLSCPIIAIGGNRDPFVNDSQLKTWALETQCDFKLMKLDGDHFFINNNPTPIIQIMFNDLNP